jgi:transaldolase
MPDTHAEQRSAIHGDALKKLAACGQSCWLDDLSRRIMAEGELSRLVAEGVRGVTANPATVAKAITSGTDYDADIKRAATEGRSAAQIYETLVTADIRKACDILRPVYDQSGGERVMPPIRAHAREARAAGRQALKRCRRCSASGRCAAER